MVTDDEKTAFAERFNLLLDYAGVRPKGKGRQVTLSTVIGIGQKGVRKWLEGEAIPTRKNMAIILKTFQKYEVTNEWLLYGNMKYAPSWVKSGAARPPETEKEGCAQPLFSVAQTPVESNADLNEKKGHYQNETEKSLSPAININWVTIPKIRFETKKIEKILSSPKQQGVELMNISSKEAPIEQWGAKAFGLQVNNLIYSALAAPGNTIIFDPDRSPVADNYVLASFVTDPESDYEIMQYKKAGGAYQLKTAREDIPEKMYALDECTIHAVMIHVNFGGKSYL